LKKPDICDIIVSAKENLYDRSKDILENLSCDNDIINSELMDRETMIQRKLDEIKRREDAERKRKEEEVKLQSQKEDMKKEFTKKALEVAKQMKDKEKKIVDYVETFQRIYDRKPTQDEIEENFKDDLEMEVVQSFLATYKGSGDLLV
jgi:CHASE3 domain sensor protein